ncbi:MAG TPA: isopentenyl-diphosphate Delta-isomerase [Natronosporangium sp.]
MRHFDRERLLVELVSDAGDPIGTDTVGQVHRPPGQLHRAFSVMLYDEAGRVLLQRRAAGKTRFASRWSNACCGHPAPGEQLAAAATDRLAAELGLAAPLTEVGVYAYRADDPVTGLVEREWDHVLVGRVRGDTVFAPDPAEVSEYAWVAPATLDAALAANPDAYTPWLPGVLRTAAASRLTG